MKRALVCGYASLDFAVGLAGHYQPGHTVLINDRSSEPWPHPGGCALYCAKPLAAAAHCQVLTWTGDDHHGDLYENEARAQGIDTSTVATVAGGATPVCMLVYERDGSCGCLFDPGFIGREVLTAVQQQAARQADLLCITVGPARIGERLLELARQDALVAWVAKNDEISFSASLRKALGMRADYIFCNPMERASVNAALQGRHRAAPVIVETAGSSAVVVEQGELPRHTLPVCSLQVIDTTGAGDTLAGGTLAAVLSGETDSKAAVRQGIDAAYRLLLPRSTT